MQRDQIDSRVTELIRTMTLDEKIGQLVQISGGFATGPENTKLDTSEMAALGQVGSVLNVQGARETNELQKRAVEESRLKIPLLFGLDVIHGYRTIYPIPLALSCSWNTELVAQCARMAAVEATSEGIRWTFSPMVDIARDSRWGRIAEGAGEDPYLGATVAAAWVRGYQNTNLSEPTSMLACAKHYVAYGAAEGGRDYDLADVPERVLRDVYLPPFKAAVDAGAGSLMSAFNTNAGIPATCNRHVLTDILRTEWGFEGFVVSDWGSVGDLMNHGVALNARQAALKSITAGLDMDMMSHCYLTELAGLVETGELAPDVIDTAVARILRLKFALGLFEQPYTDETLSGLAILAPEHIALARRAAEESFVLLKNDLVDGEPLLPLSPGKRIALIGSLADGKDDMLGMWGFLGKSQDVVTLREAFAERLKQDLTYVAAGGPKDNASTDFNDVIATANSADIVVMALGESKSMSGEAASRADIGLPGSQLDLMKAIVATGKPVILVLFNGRPLAVPWAVENIPAILEAWHPGVQTGPALSATLFGDVAPAGKLTTSFPRCTGQTPLHYDVLSTGKPPLDDQPDNPFQTGYIDMPSSPLFPFGWGLTYTTFAYSETKTSTDAIRASDLASGGAFSVEATVTNTGSRAGVEIVQLYICTRGTSVARPVRELKGFERIQLEPSESRIVRFTLSAAELAFWNIEMKHVVEPCELTVWVAPNCKSGTPTKITVNP